MLFDIAPEDSARRISEALLAAEGGDPEAWRWLNSDALLRLRSDAEQLVGLVTYAFLCLTEQLARHPRSPVRIDAVRYATLALPYAPENAARILSHLCGDRSRGVARAASAAVTPMLSSQPLSSGDMVEVSESASR